MRFILAGSTPPPSFDDFDRIFAAREAEADEFYGELQVGIADADARNVQRQALAGMLWSKQFYHYDVPRMAQWRSGSAGAAAAASQ